MTPLERRARRIASAAASSGGEAYVVKLDGAPTIVTDGGDALRDACRLERSQVYAIDVVACEDVVECTEHVRETCEGAAFRRNGTLPPGWHEVEDARGDLVGFACRVCAFRYRVRRP